MFVPLFWWNRKAPIQKYSWWCLMALQTEWRKGQKWDSATHAVSVQSLLCHCQSKLQSKIRDLHSAWFSHVCICMCLCEKLTVASAKNLYNAQNKNFKETKNDIVKIQFPHRPDSQNPSLEATIITVFFIFFQRCSLRVLLPNLFLLLPVPSTLFQTIGYLKVSSYILKMKGKWQ